MLGLGLGALENGREGGGKGNESEDAWHLLQQSSPALDREPTGVQETPLIQAREASKLTNQPTNYIQQYPLVKATVTQLVKKFSAFYPKVHCPFH